MEKTQLVMKAVGRGKGPHAVDLHVGAAVRVRRKILGMSQETLADKIGLTFQQVQKYERGSNRISASKLFEIATILKLPISRLFDGLEDDADRFSESRSEQDVHAFLMTTEGIELAQAFPGIAQPAVRRRVLELVRALGTEEHVE